MSYSMFFLVLYFSSIFLIGNAVCAQELRRFVNPSSGAEVSLPAALYGKEISGQYGPRWLAPDGSLDIVLLRFPQNRTLEDIHATIRARKVTFTQERRNDIYFSFDGRETDGRSFHLYVVDSGRFRHGISIHYIDNRTHERTQIVKAITRSFRHNTRHDGTAKYLSEFRELIQKTATTNAWADVALAARRHRLQFDQDTATRDVAQVLSRSTTSTFKSRLWGVLPSGTIASLAGGQYATEYIYGVKTDYPEIRQELKVFLEQNPSDPFAFAAHYAIGEFELAIDNNPHRIALGVLHYAAGHKRLSALLARILQEARVNRPRTGKGNCGTEDTSDDCAFYEKFTVHHGPEDGRLLSFIRYATKNRGDVSARLNERSEEVNVIVQHMRRAAELPGHPHRDDANYFSGLLNYYRGDRDEAIRRLGLGYKARTEKGYAEDYNLASLRQMIRVVVDAPDGERAALISNSEFREEPAVWYVATRAYYRDHKYEQTITIAEQGLTAIGVDPSRLTATTEPKGLERDVKRLLKKEPDRNLVELAYLFNAARELLATTRRMTMDATLDQGHARAVIMKYSLLIAGTEKERKALYDGTLRQHRDLRQALHLIEIAMRATAPHAANLRQFREWLHYRKVRIVADYEPRSAASAVAEFATVYPASELLDDAYVELMFAQAFRLKNATAAAATFKFIQERFPKGNALDNAHSWYAIHLNCIGDHVQAQRVNAEIIRKFPLTRHAAYAALRLARPKPCEM